MQFSKRRVVIVIPTDKAAQALIASNATGESQRKFDVHYLCCPDVSVEMPPRTAVVPLSSTVPKWRKKADFHLWYQALFTHFRQLGLSDSASLKASSLPRRLKWLYRLLSYNPISYCISRLDEHLLFSMDDNVTQYLKSMKPALVIAPGMALDTYSHLVIRSARRLQIPCVMVVAHWDFLSKKGLLRTRPQQIYVWGREMRDHGIGNHGLEPDSVKILGAPDFQKYLDRNQQPKHLVRQRLGLPIDGYLLLFAGTGAPFDELSALKTLDDALQARADNDMTIIYRPHPKAWPRATALKTAFSELKNVLMDPERQGRKPGDREPTPNHYYADLVSCVDALVSPFSTMVLEGALCGKPCFCMGYADGVNDWDFSESLNSEHIAPLLRRFWLRVCMEQGKLKEDFLRFLELVKDSNLAAKIREDIKSTVYYDGRSYAERLLKQIENDFFPG